MAATLVVVVLADICAVLGHKTALLATESDLWRDQSTALSEACKRGSGGSKRAGKERRADVLMVAEPSSDLAGARDPAAP